MRLMGHRGAGRELDENTLPSFELAIKAGVKIIELDIHKSMDGELVVIHDNTLDRTTDKKGKVLDLTLKEIKEAKTKSHFEVPTLKEVLTLAKKNGIELQIEIKAPDLEEKLLKLLKEEAMTLESTIICFDHRVLLKIKSLEPKIKTVGLIFGRVVDTIHMINSAKLDGLSASIYTADKELADELHQNNKTLTIWNANSKEELQFVKMIGADIVGTDYPNQIVKYV